MPLDDRDLASLTAVAKGARAVAAPHLERRMAAKLPQLTDVAAFVHALIESAGRGAPTAEAPEGARVTMLGAVMLMTTYGMVTRHDLTIESRDFRTLATVRSFEVVHRGDGTPSHAVGGTYTVESRRCPGQRVKVIYPANLPPPATQHPDNPPRILDHQIAMFPARWEAALRAIVRPVVREEA